MTAPPSSAKSTTSQRYMLSAVCGRSTYNVGRNRRAVPTHAGAASSEHAGAVQRLPDYDHRHHCRPERAAQAVYPCDGVVRATGLDRTSAADWHLRGPGPGRTNFRRRSEITGVCIRSHLAHSTRSKRQSGKLIARFVVAKTI
jgi:hypothetical protein